MDIQELFRLGMKRNIPELLNFQPGIQLNLGAGNSKIHGAIPLDWPEWDADQMGLSRYEDNSIAGIHAYHFLEHLKDPIYMLTEFDRVLIHGGVANIVVPHGQADIAKQDLDHKHFFTEETWKTLFQNQYYLKFQHKWRLKVHANFMMGVAFRNLSIFTQLVKVDD